MIQLLLVIIYISFISLGLPDGLLGAAWPNMYVDLETSVSYAGIIFMIISAGTVVSSLLSDRLTYYLGTGKLTAISVGMTAAALFGFSMSDSFLMLCLWSVPYGLGAGSVDASLNNYVALHYAGRHMSWLHCMWGVGATVGPYVMGYILSGGCHTASWTDIDSFLKSFVMEGKKNFEDGRSSCDRGSASSEGGAKNSRGKRDYDYLLLLLCVRADYRSLGKLLLGDV